MIKLSEVNYIIRCKSAEKLMTPERTDPAFQVEAFERSCLLREKPVYIKDVKTDWLQL